MKVDNPAWPEIVSMLDKAASTRAHPVAPDQGRRTLYALQATARSYLGALALHTGVEARSGPIPLSTAVHQSG